MHIWHDKHCHDKGRVADALSFLIRNQIQIALFHSYADSEQGTNFHFNVDPDPAPKTNLCESATTGLQTLHGSILSLYSERSWPSQAPFLSLYRS
jgi:hypothetical protein